MAKVVEKALKNTSSARYVRNASLFPVQSNYRGRRGGAQSCFLVNSIYGVYLFEPVNVVMQAFSKKSIVVYGLRSLVYCWEGP